MTHLGCVVPPNVDTYWVGDAGPGTSYWSGRPRPPTPSGPVRGAPTTCSAWRASCATTRSRRSGTPSTRSAATHPRRVGAAGGCCARATLSPGPGSASASRAPTGSPQPEQRSSRTGSPAQPAMADLERRAVLGHVAVAPLPQRHQDGIEVQAHLGESVALASAHGVLVRLASQNPRVDQTAEALREQGAGDPERRLEILEPFGGRERLAEDDQRPAVAQQGGRPGDRASLFGDLSGAHRRQHSETAFGIRTLYSASAFRTQALARADEENPMPKLDLTITADVLSEEQKPELMRELGAALLHWEGAPDTEFFRSITWAHLHELPPRRSRLPTGLQIRTRSSTSRFRPARSATGGKRASSRTPPSSSSTPRAGGPRPESGSGF